MEVSGWSRLVNEYNESFHSANELRARCLLVIEAHQRALAELRARGKPERNQPDADGWVVVTNRKRAARPARQPENEPKTKLQKLAENSRIRRRRPVQLV